jgi:geranylgeranyl pyrophosphate synthase
MKTISIIEEHFSQDVIYIQKTLSSFSSTKEKEIHEPVLFFLKTGGKFLRPLLVLLSAKAVHGKSISVRNAAVAVEMTHNSSLIHDDIMDNASLRRGFETVYKKYGISKAILAGDTLIFAAYLSLLKDCSGAKDVYKIVSIFSKTAMCITEGQCLELHQEKSSAVSKKAYLKMIYQKTAKLVETSCFLGAFIANPSTLYAKNISLYGKYLGIGFQIRDDLLDVIADEKIVGKKIGIDFFNGKKNYIYVVAFEKANPEQKEKLTSFISSPKKTKKMFTEYVKLCTSLFVLEDVRKEISNYVSKAISAIQDLPETQEKKYLLEIARSILL